MSAQEKKTKKGDNKAKKRMGDKGEKKFALNR